MPAPNLCGGELGATSSQRPFRDQLGCNPAVMICRAVEAARYSLVSPSKSSASASDGRMHDRSDYQVVVHRGSRPLPSQRWAA